MRRLSLFLSILALAVGLAACGSGKSSTGSPSPAAAVTGNITIKTHPAIPPKAVLDVSLDDLSMSSGPGVVLGKQAITSPGTPPIAFVVGYEPAVLDPSHSYGIQARIMANGKLWAVNKDVVLVLTKGNPTSGVSVVLERVTSG